MCSFFSMVKMEKKNISVLANVPRVFNQGNELTKQKTIGLFMKKKEKKNHSSTFASGLITSSAWQDLKRP